MSVTFQNDNILLVCVARSEYLDDASLKTTKNLVEISKTHLPFRNLDCGRCKVQTVADVKSSQPYSSLHGMLTYFPYCRDAHSGQPLYFNVIQIKLTYSFTTFYFRTLKD